MRINEAGVPANGADTDLAKDFQNVVTDAQGLLKSLGNEGGAKMDDMKNRAKNSIAVAQQRVIDLQASAVANAKAAAKSTHEYVRGNPWTAVGIGAGVGLIAGYFATRCSTNARPGDTDR